MYLWNMPHRSRCGGGFLPYHILKGGAYQAPPVAYLARLIPVSWVGDSLNQSVGLIVMLNEVKHLVG